MILALVGVLLLAGVLAGPVMSNVETPNYAVVQQQGHKEGAGSTAAQDSGGIEIRRYEGMIIAEVSVRGERQPSISAGFRLLADYIFGNNAGEGKIAMTAPVQQQKLPQQQSSQQQSSQQQSLQQGSTDAITALPEWQVSFVMPSEYSLQSLPKPSNDRVRLREVPPKTFAVIRFAGTNSEENVKEHEAELLAFLATRGIAAIGEPKYAFYNPPWTLPAMRRNEVMIEIEAEQP